MLAHVRAFFQKDPAAGFLLLLQLFPCLLDGFHAVDKLGQPAYAQLPVQFIETRCPLCFYAQRLYPTFHFGFDIVDTGQVVGRIVQTAGRFLFPHAEPGDACRFLKDGAPVFRPAVQYLVDLVLPDQEHGAFAHAGIGQQIQDIF